MQFLFYSLLPPCPHPNTYLSLHKLPRWLWTESEYPKIHDISFHSTHLSILPSLVLGRRWSKLWLSMVLTCSVYAVWGRRSSGLMSAGRRWDAEPGRCWRGPRLCNCNVPNHMDVHVQLYMYGTNTISKKFTLTYRKASFTRNIAQRHL